MRRSIQIMALPIIAALLAACDRPQVRRNDNSQESARTVDELIKKYSTTDERRFVFPAQTGAFPAYSVALDTRTGRLCKTYSWADKPSAPTGLPLCAMLTVRESDFTGAHKTYLGHTYTFDGAKWNKRQGAIVINFLSGKEDRSSDDQYDPLNLFSKEEKAKRLLTVEQIRHVANQFGVSYEEAWGEAKAQGYQVPPK